MRFSILALVAVAFLAPPTLAAAKSAAPSVHTQQQVAPPNPNIDMDAYVRSVADAAKHRESRRLTEADFKSMSGDAQTVVLDARSKEKFDLLHIDGAVNLSFPDITIDSLKRQFPDKSARILIYCNNNFKNSEAAFPSKSPAASLNISTYIALYNYGYRNVYELGPQIDPATSSLKFVSSPK